MALNRAENILATVVTTLTGLTTTGSYVYRGRTYELPDTTTEALLVYLGPDNPRSDGGSSSWTFIDSDLTINVEAVVKSSSDQVDTVLNLIRHEVQQALYADYTQGLSYVINTTEGPAIPDLSGETDQMVGRLRMEWAFQYRRYRITPTVISCAYPLDAPGSEYTGLGLLALTMSNSDTTGTYTTVGAPVSQRIAAAGPSGFSGGTSATLAFTSGKKVIQWATSVPVAVDTGSATQAYSLNVGLYTTALANVASIDIKAQKDGTWMVRVLRGAGLTAVYTNSTATSCPATVDLIMNGSASTFSARIDGVEVTLSADGFTPGSLIALETVVEFTTSDAADAAKTITATQRTQAANITGTWSSGETDPCGNAL